MIILSLNNISLSFGTETLLNKVAFSIQEKERVGLVGVNGAGKSTLFKIIAGGFQPDSGEIYVSKGLKMAYLRQNSGFDSENTLWDEMISAFSHLMEMEARLKVLEKKCSTETNELTLASLMKEYATLSDRFMDMGGYEYVGRTRGILRGLSFDDSMFTLKISTLSGGQKTRLALAKLLLSEPDILLLDEPTNHLDITALEWLETFLKNYAKTVLLISHDRYFLDAVTNKTIEIENCECTSYDCNYSGYVQKKAIHRELQQKQYELQNKEISRLEGFIQQQRQWNRERNIIAAESRMKAIDRMTKLDKPKKLPDKISIRFRTDTTSGNDVLYAENLSMHYPGKDLFNSVGFKVKKNERLFILGPNGCGKSTLLKILCGKLVACSGCVEYGHNVTAATYDQEHEDLEDNSNILDEVWAANEKLTQTEVRNALASFLFKSEDVLKSIAILSGGEKSRVSLLKLILSGANLIFLDEPTNHLDIDSREALEAALRDYEGTLIMVSHDRYFINKLATRILDLSDRTVSDYHGCYSDYQIWKQRNQKANQLESPEKKATIAKTDYLQNKEQKSRQRRIEKQLNDTENEITQTESRLSQIDVEMAEACANHLKLVALGQEQSTLHQKLDALYTLWETLTNENAEFDSN